MSSKSITIRKRSFARRLLRRPLSSYLSLVRLVNIIFFIINAFIHSRCFYSAASSPLPLRGAPDYSSDTVSELTPKRYRKLRVKVQGPYVVARVGFERA